MTDRFSNPVPDGTAANFRSNGNGIGAQCTTATTATESGLCTVNWVSKDPRPANGRSALMVSAIGEDSFIDANANGIFDPPNDNATPGVGWFEAQEPFEDDNENGVWDPGEPFLDYNGNGLHDGPGPNDHPLDGLFHGVLCSDLRGGTTSICSSQQSTAIGSGWNTATAKPTVIVLSGSHANFTLNTSATLGASGYSLPATFNITIADDRGQQMPSGTIVSASISASAGSILNSSTYTWPCTAAPGGVTISYIATPPQSSPMPGYLFVTVKTPMGTETDYAVPLSN